MKKNNLQNVLNIVGGGVALISIIFVIVRFLKYWEQLPDDFFTMKLVIIVLILGGVYGVANLILSSTWGGLMNGLHQDISRRDATRIYGVTQLGKYIPGNIFQLAGRQAIAMSYGFSGKAIAKSSALELILLIMAGMSFSLWIVPTIYPKFNIYYSSLLVLIFFIGLAVAHNNARMSFFVKAFIRYYIFLFISGGVFLCVLSTVVNNLLCTPSLALSVISVYVISWLVGLVTPGSPAGMGVREFVLVLLLKPFISELDIIMAALIARVVTVIGDCYFYGYSILLKKVDASE
jgi:uncharacterized membrane protein YbhN (UPF0104 family)